MLVEKYKPRSIKEIVNQEEAVRIFLKWANDWKKGEALLIYGPPGNGKTALVEAYANEKNIDLIELNASDFRSASEVSRIIGSSMKQQSLMRKNKIFLIDEIDGLAGREDFGGVGEIIKIIKESIFPVVLTANNPWDTKFRELRSHCKVLQFKKIPSVEIEKRLKDICYKEKIRNDEIILREIAKRSKGDLRSAINDLEMISLGKNSIERKDLEILNDREREENIFEVLRVLFKTKSFVEARRIMDGADKDVDEIFWWLEHNITNEYQNPEEVAKAFDLLSKADIFKRRIMINQNYRFEKYIRDLMACVALVKNKPYYKFTLYRPPDRLITLGRTKGKRQEMDKFHGELGRYLHCSKNKVKEQMPYLKIMLRI